MLNAADAKLLWQRYNAAALRRPSLDRINPDGHYETGNCRFIEFEQNINWRHHVHQGNHAEELSQP